jgi:hypothetical protein
LLRNTLVSFCHRHFDLVIVFHRTPSC